MTTLHQLPPSLQREVGKVLKDYLAKASVDDVVWMLDSKPDESGGRWITVSGKSEVGGKARRILIGKGGKILGAKDAEFEESKHPRGQPENAGQFAKTSGSDLDKETKEPPSEKSLSSSYTAPESEKDLAELTKLDEEGKLVSGSSYPSTDQLKDYVEEESE